MNQQEQAGDLTHKSNTTTNPAIPSEPDKNPHSSDYAPYPKLQPTDVVPPPLTETWTSVSIAPQPQSEPQAPSDHPPATPAFQAEARAPIAADSTATSMPSESNPYVSPSPAPAPGSSAKSECSFYPPAGFYFLFFCYSVLGVKRIEIFF